MAEGKEHEVPLRRRREGSTDYGKRLEMLKSGNRRAVIRVSNQHARVQIVEYGDEGDHTVTSASSGDLEEYGWDYSTGNLPAAYLTGFLAGYRAQEEGVENVIADLGVHQPQEGSRHHACVQGVADSGLEIPFSGSVTASEERVRSEHADSHESGGITETFEKVRDNIMEEHGG